MPRNRSALPGVRIAVFVVAGFISYGPRAIAQESATQNPPPYRGVNTHMDGVFVTPVPNVPLTAVAELETTQILQDGSTETKKTTNNIARDSQGRIYNERRDLVPESFNGTPQLISIHIYDPGTKLNTLLDPYTHIARQSVKLETAAAMATAQSSAIANIPNRPGYQQQDLGTESMENVVVHGVRKMRTIPAASTGTGTPVIITDEYWYSDELHLNMLVKHEDPRTGQQTVTISHVDRSEPPRATFEIPADYKIVDETPVTR